MRTVVIFDNFDNGVATCAVVEGDFTHLHNYFLNTEDHNEVLDQVDMLTKDICQKYGVNEWYTHHLPEFPSAEFFEAVKDGAAVIVTGCMP